MGQACGSDHQGGGDEEDVQAALASRGVFFEAELAMEPVELVQQVDTVFA